MRFGPADRRFEVGSGRCESARIQMHHALCDLTEARRAAFVGRLRAAVVQADAQLCAGRRRWCRTRCPGQRAALVRAAVEQRDIGPGVAEHRDGHPGRATRRAPSTGMPYAADDFPFALTAPGSGRQRRWDHGHRTNCRMSTRRRSNPRVGPSSANCSRPQRLAAGRVLQNLSSHGPAHAEMVHQALQVPAPPGTAAGRRVLHHFPRS